VAYTLIKNYLFIPKFNFLLRTTPFWNFSNYVNSIDSSLKSCLERILNLRLTDLQWRCLRFTITITIDLQWRQSTLPIRFGGLGIRRISDICLPAFLSSINGVKKLVSLLLNSKDNELNIHHYDEVLAVWGVANENEIPTIPQFQKNWDNINPNSHNITQTYNTKINKYLELSVAMRNLWCLEKISILPLVISATGIVPQSLFKNLKILDLDNTLVVEIQKGILLYSCHIVRKFLNIDTEHNTQQSQNAEARRR
jgi:hypothetical protein